MKYSGLRERFVNFPAPAIQSRSARLYSQSTSQSDPYTTKQQIACETHASAPANAQQPPHAPWFRTAETEAQPGCASRRS